MTNFKKGDRVRYVNDTPLDSPRRGEEATVLGPAEYFSGWGFHQVPVRFDKADLNIKRQTILPHSYPGPFIWVHPKLLQRID